MGSDALSAFSLQELALLHVLLLLVLGLFLLLLLRRVLFGRCSSGRPVPELLVPERAVVGAIGGWRRRSARGEVVLPISGALLRLLRLPICLGRLLLLLLLQGFGIDELRVLAVIGSDIIVDVRRHDRPRQEL